MTPEQRNLLNYALSALMGAVVATGLQLSVALAGTDPILWRPLAATFMATLFGALATAWRASMLTRYGRENIGALVKEVGPEKAKDVLAIEAIKQDIGVTTTLSDTDIERITDRLLAENEARRMAATEGRG